MKLISLLFIIVISSMMTYCNLPLTSHTSLNLKINNTNEIKFSFLNIKNETIAQWKQANKYLHWYNEEGYNGNGPGIPVDKILTITKIIIESPSCKPTVVNVEFIKEYRPQNYTKYLHHGSKAHMQYTFSKSVNLECGEKAKRIPNE